MSYERLSQEENRVLVKEHEKEWGRYNDSLPNLTEITAEEFAQSGFFTWNIQGFEFRQVDPERIDQSKLLYPIKHFINFRIFYLNSPNESGFVMANDYWGKKVRYFKFANCFHDYKEISAKEAGKPAWNYYHYYKCTKCGQHNEVDSSG